MTENERIEAAAKRLATLNGCDWKMMTADYRSNWRGQVRRLLAEGFPELSGPESTHVIVPREPTEEINPKPKGQDDD